MMCALLQAYALATPAPATHALQPSGSGSSTPTSGRCGFLYTDFRTSRSLAVCACAKCGSTSVDMWLYESIYGHSWHDDKKAISSSKSEGNKWAMEALHGADIHSIGSWPTPPNGTVSGGEKHEKHASYDPDLTTVITVVRDPLDRYRSAWARPARCKHGKPESHPRSPPPS